MDSLKAHAHSPSQPADSRNTIHDEMRITPSGPSLTRDELAVLRRVLELLREGIAAAKEGNRETARELLLDAASLDPENELAWLWLSGLADSPEEAAAFLHRVLTLNPRHPHARDGMVLASMQAGIVAAMNSLRALARHHFRNVLDINPQLEEAWLRLASVSDSLEEGLAFVQRAVDLDPTSTRARMALKWIEEQSAASSEAEGWEM